jgi:hypothetical protein
MPYYLGADGRIGGLYPGASSLAGVMEKRPKFFEPGREPASLPPITILILVALLAVIGTAKAIQSIITDKTGANALYFLGGSALVLVIDRLKEVERTPDGGWRIALQDAIQEEVKNTISNEVNPQIKAAANMAISAYEIAGATAAPRSTPIPVEAGAAPPQEMHPATYPDATAVPLPPPTVADDPQKGRFGGKAQHGGRCLTASCDEASANARFLRVNLEVSRVDPSTPPLEGWVIFYLHDTFMPSVQTVAVQDGLARLSLLSYGAFTVGAVADGGATLLELDLAQDARLPEAFRNS